MSFYLCEVIEADPAEKYKVVHQNNVNEGLPIKVGQYCAIHENGTTHVVKILANATEQTLKKQVAGALLTNWGQPQPSMSRHSTPRALNLSPQTDEIINLSVTSQSLDKVNPSGDIQLNSESEKKPPPLPVKLKPGRKPSLEPKESKISAKLGKDQDVKNVKSDGSEPVKNTKGTRAPNTNAAVCLMWQLHRENEVFKRKIDLLEAENAELKKKKATEDPVREQSAKIDQILEILSTSHQGNLSTSSV